MQTLLQSQICTLSGRSAGPAARGVGQRAQRVVDRLAGPHGGDERLGAARVAEEDRAHRAAVADGELAVDAGRGSATTASRSPPASPAETRSMPATFSLALGTEPR